MSDIFISYSRKDKPFVERLVTALQERGKIVWVDWENIPLTADWMQEIEVGIEEADNFLFVISPDSAGSEIAQREVKYAASHNKRFVPVLYREPDRNQVDLPGAISSHNWVFIRDEDDFDKAMTSLLTTIDTDLEYVRGHTRLLTRAIEWSDKDHDNSFLLRGNELQEAGDLLKQAEAKRPSITALQVDYIAASKQAESWRRRERMFSIIIAIAFLVALGATAYALSENQRAQTQSRRAQELSLAANSQVALSNYNRDLAIALGLFAIENYTTGSTVRPETERALADAAYSPGTIARIEIPDGSAANSVDVTATGDVIISGTSNGMLNFWHQVGDKLEGMSMPAFADVPNADSPITDVEVSPNSDIVAFSSSNGLVGVVDFSDIDNMEVLYVLDGHEGSVDTIAFDSTGRRLISGGEDGSLLRWQLTAPGQTLRPVVLVEDLGGEILALDYHPEQDLILAMVQFDAPESGTNFTKVVPILIDGEEGEIILTVDEHSIGEVNQDVAAASFHPDGQTIATSYGLDLHLWSIVDLLSGKELARPIPTLREFVGHGSFVTSLAFSPDGEQLISSDRRDTSIRIWDVKTGSEERRFEGHSSVIQDVAISADGRYALSGSNDASVRIWELSNGAQRWLFDGENGPVLDIYSVDYSADGTRIIVGGDDAIVYEIDIESNEVIHRYEGHDTRIWILKYDPTGQFIFSAGGDGQVIQWNIENHSIEHYFSHPDMSTITALDLYNSEAGLRLVAGASDGVIAIWDVASKNLIQDYYMANASTQLRAVEFSNDGQSLLIGANDNRAYYMTWRVAEDFEERLFIEVETPQNRQLLHNTRVNTVAFAPGPNSNIVATGESDGTIRVWNVRDGSERELKGHTGQVRSVAFDQTGNRILSSSADTTLRLWDVNSGLEVRQFQGHERWVNQAVFSPDGNEAVSGSWDETIRIWSIHNVDQLITWIHEHRYIRELSCPERAIYLVGADRNCSSGDA